MIGWTHSDVVQEAVERVACSCWHRLEVYCVAVHPDVVFPPSTTYTHHHANPTLT
jgi:hypothetical protein